MRMNKNWGLFSSPKGEAHKEKLNWLAKPPFNQQIEK